jgi:predicted nucleotidyltransferase
MKAIYITQDDYDDLKSIFKSITYPVLVFGSRIKGTHRKFSDLDICLKSDKPVSLQELAELKIACSESNLPFTVDVVDYQTLSTEFKNLIDTEAVDFNNTYPAIGR